MQGLCWVCALDIRLVMQTAPLELSVHPGFERSYLSQDLGMLNFQAANPRQRIHEHIVKTDQASIHVIDLLLTSTTKHCENPARQ